MHIFVTGATGWVGSQVVQDLLANGHQVTGLARTAEKARAATDAGAAIVQGTLDDLDLLRTRAAAADAVIHTAFDHDWAHFAASVAQDARAIAAFGDALAGSDKPLLVTSGLGLPVQGRLATETDRADPHAARQSEAAAAAQRARGVRVAVMRLAPSVHGLGERHGFVPILARIARATGVSAYVEAGANRWAGVHRDDAARLFRLALEDGLTLPAYHAVADAAVPTRAIADVIGRRLGLPVERRPADHFGWFARMAAAELSASSEMTRAATGWAPTGPALLADIDQPDYYAE